MARVMFICFCLMAIFAVGTAFSPHLGSNNKMFGLSTQHRAKAEKFMVAVPENPTEVEAKRPVITVGEFFTPPYIDRTNVAILLTGQMLLTLLALGAGRLLNIDVIYGSSDVLSFDIESMKQAAFVCSLLLTAGLVVDRLPGPFFENLYRDTKYFTLRLLGRNSAFLPATATAFVTSCSSAISEELFFRGFLFQLLASTLDPTLALAASSVIFGIAHFPVFGAAGFGPTAIVESALGAVFGAAYWWSGYNLAVPIAIHGLYDFGTIMVTWTQASSDLRKRILEAKEFELKQLFKADPKMINSIARMVFNFLDTDRDGYLSEPELTQGFLLFNPRTQSFQKAKKSARDLFATLDTDKDNRISFKEFSSLMMDPKTGTPTWLFKAAAISDQVQEDQL